MNKHEKFYGCSNRCSRELHSIHDVAAFICNEGQYSDVTIADEFGVVLATTFGTLLNYTENLEFRNELMRELFPMQTGQAPTDYYEK